MSAAANTLVRELHAVPDVGIAAHIRQGRELQILRMHSALPALILVDRGIKSVRNERGAAVCAQPGQAIVLAGGQTLDFTNAVDAGQQYEARWLVFDPALLDDPYYAERAAHAGSAPLSLLPQVQAGLAAAFASARQALAPVAAIPAAVARQRMLEVLHWLLEAGIALRRPPLTADIPARIRTLVAQRPDASWTAAQVASALALSQATLRRRLADENTTLTGLLADVRMATALTLLQATTQPVSAIALSVGYESPSRFAIRFRQRFGFAPTAVRGHDRVHNRQKVNA
jgi:AraC-like DNA-binding protein